jgi:hypothetical protein
MCVSAAIFLIVVYFWGARNKKYLGMFTLLVLLEVTL